MKKIIAIDIGNTCTHIALADADTATVNTDYLFVFYNSEFDSRFLQALKNILADNKNIHGINISSCVNTLASRAVSAVGSLNTKCPITKIKHHDKLPIRVNYEDPQTLGTDRLCAALACAFLFPNQTTVIIDAGTAVTIDLLRDGKIFEGGVILPGIEMQKRALYGGADALKKSNAANIAEKNYNISYPSLSTSDCINTGVIYGIAGAIEKIAKKYPSAKMVSCGGAWENIAPYIDNPKITNIPDLTIIGAGLYEIF